MRQIGQAGLETPPKNTGETAILDQSGAESGALAAPGGEFDADLALVVEHWPELDDQAKREILALIASHLPQTTSKQAQG